MKRAILFIVLLVQPGRAASSQVAPHNLNKPVDRGHITTLAGTVPQASVDPLPIRLPIVDGRDIRFARISTAEGLSQTKVGQIVQDNQGFMWFGTQYGLLLFVSILANSRPSRISIASLHPMSARGPW
jgi:ligand-binding sensor domain-containing protein